MAPPAACAARAAPPPSSRHQLVFFLPQLVQLLRGDTGASAVMSVRGRCIAAVCAIA
jgi:hypothetical protein